MKRRDICLDSYGISKAAYRELKYFCLQHNEKKQAVNNLLGLSGVCYTGVPSKSGPGDPTGLTAQKIAVYENDIAMVENTAKEVSPELFSYIVYSVANDVPFDRLGIPCGRRQFYEMRRKFFYLLFLKKGNAGDVKM